MPSFKELKTRITSISNTKKITKAMKLVAASKFNRAQSKIIAARPYAGALHDVIVDLTESVSKEDHPLLKNRAVKRIQVLVIASDKGLCGSFNSNVLKDACRFIQEKSDLKLEIEVSCIGRKSRQFFEKTKYNISHRFDDILDKPKFSDAKIIADTLLNDYISQTHDAMFLVYNEFKSVMQQTSVVEQLIPIQVEPQKEQRPKIEFLLEPSLKEILENVLPRYFTTQIYRAILESVASEHGARMTAMDNATNNASDLIDQLRLQYNKLRQASITTEILEVIGGAEALNQGN